MDVNGDFAISWFSRTDLYSDYWLYRENHLRFLDLCDLWPWPRPLTLTLKQGNGDARTGFLAFDLDLWPTTLTYNPRLARVKVDPHAKNQGQRSNGSHRRARTHRHTDRWTDRQTDATKCIIDKYLSECIITILYWGNGKWPCPWPLNSISFSEDVSTEYCSHQIWNPSAGFAWHGPGLLLFISWLIKVVI